MLFQRIHNNAAALMGVVVIFAIQVSVLCVSTKAETFPTLTSALDEIAPKYRVRVGMEYAPNDPDRTPITLDLSANKIEPTLDQLVIQKPEYIWKFDDGVYEIQPKLNSDSILDEKIGLFAIRNGSLKEASDALDKLPEKGMDGQARSLKARTTSGSQHSAPNLANYIDANKCYAAGPS